LAVANLSNKIVSMVKNFNQPPKATLIGSLCPPPNVSKQLAKAISPSYASPSPSLKSKKTIISYIK